MEDLILRKQPEIVLTDGTTVNIDPAKGHRFVLSGSTGRNLDMTAAGYPGQIITIRWKNTGGSPITHTLIVASTNDFRFMGSANALPPTAAGASDYLTAVYNATDSKWEAVAIAGYELEAYVNEIIAARGSRSALGDRIGVISNFASPNAGGIVTGNFYDNCFQGSASGTLIGAADRIDLAPYFTSVNLTIDQIGIACSTAVASATCKIVIYAAGSDGWPAALLYESATLDCGTTGYKQVSISFTFNSGTQYWIGVRHSSTATLRTVAVASSVNLGVNGSNGSNYFTVLRRTLTYATAATDPWAFTSTDLVANVTPPSIRFRAA